MFLKDNDKYTFRDMGKILKKETNNVYRKCKELNIKKVGANKSKIDLPPKFNIVKKDKIFLIFGNSIIKNTNTQKECLINTTLLNQNNPYQKQTKKSWGNMTKEKIKNLEIPNKDKQKSKNNTLNPMLNRSNPYSRTKSGKRGFK